MPDRDWYDFHIRRNWRGVARRIQEGEGFARVGDLALRAVTRTLREASDVPGLDGMMGVVCSYADGGTIPQAFAQLRETSLQAGGSDLTQIAKLAAEKTIVAIDRSEGGSDLPHEFISHFITCTLERYLFAPARHRWVGSRFASMQESHKWQGQCIETMTPRIDKLADSIRRHRFSAALRTPRRTVERQPTSELLFEPVKLA